jgi:hypothetical protein
MHKFRREIKIFNVFKNWCLKVWTGFSWIRLEFSGCEQFRCDSVHGELLSKSPSTSVCTNVDEMSTSEKEVSRSSESSTHLYH